jgi:PadR family transcriptional regulator, regulatory protein AphA
LRLLTTELDFRRQQQHEKVYSDDLDPAQAAIEVNLDWNQELVRMGRERSYLLGTTYLTWLELAHARLSEQVESFSKTVGDARSDRKNAS